MALDLFADGIRVISTSRIWSPEVFKAAMGGREKWEPMRVLTICQGDCPCETSEA